MLTPSGRFEVNKKICLSISSFHPETWQPSWGIRTALLRQRPCGRGLAQHDIGLADTRECQQPVVIATAPGTQLTRGGRLNLGG